MTWVPCTYDPDLNMLFVGTGNPQPVIAGKAAREAICLLSRSSRWISTPANWSGISSLLLTIRMTGMPSRRRYSSMEKSTGSRASCVAQASRNGWFFVLDRKTGKNYVPSEYVKTNWAKGVDAKGQPIPNPAKEPQIDGALVRPNQGGAANWPPPSFSPQTGLFYVNATRAYSIYYIFDEDEKPEGWGGNDQGGWGEAMLQAIDYKTGKIRWSHKWEGVQQPRRRSQHCRQPGICRRSRQQPCRS